MEFIFNMVIITISEPINWIIDSDSFKKINAKVKPKIGIKPRKTPARLTGIFDKE